MARKKGGESSRREGAGGGKSKRKGRRKKKGKGKGKETEKGTGTGMEEEIIRKGHPEYDARRFNALKRVAGKIRKHLNVTFLGGVQYDRVFHSYVVAAAENQRLAINTVLDNLKKCLLNDRLETVLACYSAEDGMEMMRDRAGRKPLFTDMEISKAVEFIEYRQRIFKCANRQLLRSYLLEVLEGRGCEDMSELTPSFMSKLIKNRLGGIIAERKGRGRDASRANITQLEVCVCV